MKPLVKPTNRRRALLLGESLPQEPAQVPYSRTRLYSWFKRIGMDQEAVLQSFHLEPVLNFYPEGQSASKDWIAQYIEERRGELTQQIIRAEYGVIVTLGILSTRFLLGKDVRLDEVVGRSHEISFQIANVARKVQVIPLPHPSGASSWIYLHDNARALERALELVKNAMR